MREQSVPCRGSTLRESIAGLHRTFNDSAMCDRCEVVNARSRERVRDELAARASARGVGAGGATPAAPPAQPSDGAACAASSVLSDAAPSAPYANTSRRYLAGLRRTHTRVTRTMRQSSSDVVLTEPSGRVTTH